MNLRYQRVALLTGSGGSISDIRRRLTDQMAPLERNVGASDQTALVIDTMCESQEGERHASMKSNANRGEMMTRSCDFGSGMKHAPSVTEELL
jgi:hypothetical protein